MILPGFLSAVGVTDAMPIIIPAPVAVARQLYPEPTRANYDHWGRTTALRIKAQAADRRGLFCRT